LLQLVRELQVTVLFHAVSLRQVLPAPHVTLAPPYAVSFSHVEPVPQVTVPVP
jgi:hypothetical protein